MRVMTVLQIKNPGKSGKFKMMYFTFSFVPKISSAYISVQKILIFDGFLISSKNSFTLSGFQDSN
jgi:hypothetical protein